MVLAGILPWAGAQEPGKRWSERMAESAMLDGGYQNIYDYVDATAMKAFRALWQETGDETYYNYLKTAVDDDLQDYYDIASSDYHDIDPVNGGSLILLLQRQTGEAAYRSAADSLLKFLWAFPRTSDGGFYHKDSPHMQVDDLYMGAPFLAEYGQLREVDSALEDAARQAILMERHTRDSITGLYYHVWYEEAEGQFDTGCNPVFWGRGMGWVAMALVDVLDFLPAISPDRDSVLAVFQRLALAVSTVQDDATGVWWQVLNRPALSGNFLESSASCMFTYALAKGIRMGYLDDSYREVVQKAYQGILKQFIRDNGDGTIRITSVCPGQSPSELFGPYLRSTYENQHGLGPFILASVEIEMYGLPPSDLTAKALSDTTIRLNWRDNMDHEEGFRVERVSDGDFEEIALLPADTREYLDTTAIPLTYYEYRVCAFSGDSTTYWSNKAWAISLAENGAPAFASHPVPADGAVCICTDATLSWTPGETSITHQVYLGTEIPLSIVASRMDSIYVPDTLYPGTTYYWRIDEINGKGTTTGPLWTFTTKGPPGLVAHWTMDELVENQVLDDSDFGNHGTPYNMDEQAWTEGISGNAVRFDGVDDYIRVPHHSVINFAVENFTVTFWVWLEKPARRMTLLEKGDAGGQGKGYGFYVDPLPDSSNFGEFKITFILQDGIHEPDDAYIVEGRHFDTAEWIHIAGRRRISDQVFWLLLNGEVTGLTHDDLWNIAQEEDLYFGFSPGSDTSYFCGVIDDVRIYNYALTDQEILSQYEELKPSKVHPPSFISSPGSLAIYPNPFRTGTTLHFRTEKQGKVKLRIYDMSGREVALIMDGDLPSGEHKLSFDASGLEPGPYIVRLQTGSFVASERMLMIK
jgi:unsaturated rhamnogalacturonyl hydrolase